MKAALGQIEMGRGRCEGDLFDPQPDRGFGYQLDLTASY